MRRERSSLSFAEGEEEGASKEEGSTDEPSAVEGVDIREGGSDS
jgi:hypothetical protein